MSHVIVYSKHYCIPAINFIFGVEVFCVVNIFIYLFFQFRTMSDQEEEADSQNAVDSSKEREDALVSINIPVPSEEVPESDQTEDYESELDPSSGGREKRTEKLSDQSVSSLEPNDVEQLVDDVMMAERAEDGGGSLMKSGSAVQSARPYSKVSLTFLEKVKAVKESLRITTKDSLATGIT